jgi:hypothetical protein
MVRLGFVGDCSQGDVTLYAKAIDAALAASDEVVLLGDVNSSDGSSYELVKARLGTNKLSVIPGNHDTQGPGDWARLGGLPKQWRVDRTEGVTLIGLDNSGDDIGAAGWAILDAYAAAPTTGALFVCVHKALSPLVLPDGTESTHIVSEQNWAQNGDAAKLRAWVKAHGATLCCGHYHGASVLLASYGSVILEGRGGSQSTTGPSCGWTSIMVQPEGWTAHQIAL